MTTAGTYRHEQDRQHRRAVVQHHGRARGRGDQKRRRETVAERCGHGGARTRHSSRKEIEQPDQDHDGKAEPHRARMEHARLQHQWCAGKQHQREAGPLRLQVPQRSGEERLGGRTSCKRRVGQYGCHPPTFVLSLRPDVTPRMVAGRLIVAGAVLALDMPHLDVI